VSEKLPKYAPLKTIATCVAEVSRQQLNAWSDLGFVRTAKLGEGAQAARLYNISDVLEVIDRLCLGRKPTKKRKPPRQAP
jgi:hypothetical protein